MSEPNTGQPAPWPTPTVPPTSRASGTRAADVTVSVILMVGGLVVFGALAILPLFITAFADSCTAERCDAGLMQNGALVGVIATPTVFLAASIWALVRIARRKTAWWVVVAGAVAAAVASGTAFALVYAGIA